MTQIGLAWERLEPESPVIWASSMGCWICICSRITNEQLLSGKGHGGCIEALLWEERWRGKLHGLCLRHCSMVWESLSIIRLRMQWLSTGLHKHTVQSEFHCKPSMQPRASDLTTLSLSFLNYEGLIIVIGTIYNNCRMYFMEVLWELKEMSEKHLA